MNSLSLPKRTHRSVGLTNPFHALNLWRNPFGELARGQRAELALVDVDQWRVALEDSRTVLQFIGPCGYGKTTHLLAIEKCCPSFRYIYLPEQSPRPVVPDERPLMIDEAQRLGFWRLRRVLTLGGPLVLATHVDHSAAIARAGLRCLTVDVTLSGSVGRLKEILNRRVEASRLREGDLPVITDHQASHLQSRWGGNIRGIEHFLFEQFQRCALEGLSWPIASCE
ncbi:MAG TPA: hypothetical protein DCF63_02525 [Planctomycetaceae bacterium]|nr:hypothetical protein [Planctomycetaceae bacterium]